MLIGFIFIINKDLIYGYYFVFYCQISICYLRLIWYSGGFGVVKVLEIFLFEINYFQIEYIVEVRFFIVY